MKLQNLSVKRLFGRVAMGLVLSMSGITIALFLVTKQTAVLLTGGALLLCALVGIFVLTQAFGKRLSQFTADLCQTLDHMIAGNEAPQRPEDSETQLARIGHRLARLYQIMQENRRRVDEERQELQTLVSDISHQVKTPVSNLKMATDTLLEKPMTEAERTDFIRGIRSQTDKLDFLFQALVKTSRLETGKSFPDISLIEPLCQILDISVSEFMLGKRIEPEHYQEETEKAWIASLDEPLLYKIQMIIYILEIAAVAVLQVPLFSHGPMCVNIICWAVWGALFFAAYYLDKKIPERKLRYSNPWIEGVFSVIYFLCYMLWFFLRKDEWGTLPMSEQMSLWAIIVVGLIVGVCVRVFLARKKRRSAV